jgi:hypothetical protein
MDSNEALQEAYGLLQRAVELIELGGWPGIADELAELAHARGRCRVLAADGRQTKKGPCSGALRLIGATQTRPGQQLRYTLRDTNALRPLIEVYG